MYFEPSWLTEPPEDTRKVLGECEYCGQELLTGDTAYYSSYDEGKLYCSDDCFTVGEMVGRVLS